MLDLVVIIVTWNVRHLIRDALRTLADDLRASGLDSKVWVVDNASTDGTAEAIRTEFPAVQLIASPTNLGFAGGNNAAMRAFGFCDQPTPNPNGPRVVFLLNPDTLTQPGAIRALYDALFRMPRAGVAGARLSYEDGTFQHSAFRFPGLMQIVLDLFPIPGRLYNRLHESRLNGRYNRNLYERRDPFPVDHTLGATIMLKREVIEQVGLFDEQFFMYCEEIDWAMRIRQAGWEIYSVPTAHITHLEAKSSSQVRPQSIVNLWTSRFLLYRKHYSRPKLALARWLVRLGMQQKISAAQRDATLSSDQRTVLIEAYRKVIALARA